DQGLGEVVVGEADGLQHRARAGPVGAFGQRGADALRGIGLAVVRARHRGPFVWFVHAPAGLAAKGTTSTAGKRSASVRAHASANSARAQTITVGPEPDRVAPS